MNKITFASDESYRGVSRDLGLVAVSFDLQANTFAVSGPDGKLAEVSDRADLEHRFGWFVDVEVL